MNKTELRKLIREVVEENRWMMRYPGGKDFPMDTHAVWEDEAQAKKLIETLLRSIDAGNFTMAFQILRQLSDLHT